MDNWIKCQPESQKREQQNVFLCVMLFK